MPGYEPPLKRARSGSAADDPSSAWNGGDGDLSRDGTPGAEGGDGGGSRGWRSGEDRETRDAALAAELMRYMIRSEPLGSDRHHQRYWHMQVRRRRPGRLR